MAAPEGRRPSGPPRQATVWPGPPEPGAGHDAHAEPVEHQRDREDPVAPTGARNERGHDDAQGRAHDHGGQPEQDDAASGRHHPAPRPHRRVPRHDRVRQPDQTRLQGARQAADEGRFHDAAAAETAISRDERASCVGNRARSVPATWVRRYPTRSLSGRAALSSLAFLTRTKPSAAT